MFLRFKSTYITYCISGDELTISTSFTNGNVLFSWGNLEKKFYYVKINNGAWSRVSEPKYIVKDALKYDYISILIRVFEERPKDYTLAYNGELCMVLPSLQCTLLILCIYI